MKTNTKQDEFSQARMLQDMIKELYKANNTTIPDGKYQVVVLDVSDTNDSMGKSIAKWTLEITEPQNQAGKTIEMESDDDQFQKALDLCTNVYDHLDWDEIESILKECVFQIEILRKKIKFLHRID